MEVASTSFGESSRPPRTSDGIEAVIPSAELVAQRAELYRAWVIKVSGKRPLHHEFVRVPADPLNWAPVTKRLQDMTVALISTGGVHLKTQEPFTVFEEVGDWSWRAIPGDVDTAELTVTHTHYAIQDALEDVNVIFPLDRLRDLEREDLVGHVAERHFGFMGFIPDPVHLVEETAPAAADELRTIGVDAAVLTAG